MKAKDSSSPIALRTREAAAALGISERTLQQLTSAGEVPVVKIGRANLYPVKELSEWLSRRTTNTPNTTVPTNT